MRISKPSQASRKKKIKSILGIALTLMLCIGMIPATAMADEIPTTIFDSNGYPEYIQDAKISNIQLYSDNSLKSFDLSITPACAYDPPYKGESWGDHVWSYFTPGSTDGAISIHSEQFGTESNNWTSTMDGKYSVYQGSGMGGHNWVGPDGPQGGDIGYWEAYLYKDYSCTELATSVDEWDKTDIVWGPGTGKPEKCNFITWGQYKDSSGNTTNHFDLTIGIDKRITTSVTMTFNKGIIPLDGNKTYYVYQWNKWSGDFDPQCIYPDRLIFTLNASSNGIVIDDVTDTVEITGNPSVGSTLTANIKDVDGDNAKDYWTNYKWIIDEKVVGEGLTYKVTSQDSGKEITFTCEGASEGRTGLLMDSITIGKPESSPATGDNAPLMAMGAILLIAAAGGIMVGRRRFN